jgi:hypothetical protein
LFDEEFPGNWEKRRRSEEERDRASEYGMKEDGRKTRER